MPPGSAPSTSNSPNLRRCSGRQAGSGINRASPSFAAVGEDDYAHVNPLGAGNYRGYVCVDANGTDADEARTAVPFALEVTAPANQAPAFSNDTFAFNVAAAAANGATVGTVAATDPNVGDTLTYAITAGNTGTTFAIDAATGAITVAGAPLTPNAVFDLTVTATDGGGLSDTATVRVTVGDAGDRIFADDFEQ